MLVTDVGDEMCWRELWDDDDGFGRFVTNILYLVRLATSKNVTNIKIPSPTYSQQHLCSRLFQLRSFLNFEFICKAGIHGISGSRSNWSGLVCQFEFFFGPGPILVRVNCRCSGIDLF